MMDTVRWHNPGLDVTVPVAVHRAAVTARMVLVEGIGETVDPISVEQIRRCRRRRMNEPVLVG